MFYDSAASGFRVALALKRARVVFGDLAAGR
jgi:hypothetical protein